MIALKQRYVKLLLVNVPCFVLLVAALFSYPAYPSFGLDASWSMALGQFFHEGLQFGPEVAFTFGPLGFLYGNTYMGVYFWSLLGWQLLAAAVCAVIIITSAQRLTDLRQIIYFGFFLGLGPVSTDAVHQMIITMSGFALLHRNSETWRPTPVLPVLFLALLANIKFTNVLLAGFAVLLVCGQELVQGHWRRAWRIAACFLAGFLTVWMVCGQSPANIPLYLQNSWQLSQGYSQAMARPTPAPLFWLGVAVLVTLAAYGVLYLILHVAQARTLSRCLLLAGFMYLVWKHGYARSQGHMLIFFISALLPVVAFPALLDDPPHRRWLAQVLLVCAGLLCLVGLHSTSLLIRMPDVLWHAPSRLQDKLWRHYSLLGQWAAFRASYEERFAQEKQRFDLPRTRAVIGQAPIDVLGYEQATALYNGLTYRPRPVFQSYSAYTPYLAGLNDAFYRSNRAPDYALLKLQTIDNRFPTLDDSLLLRSFMYRYDYVHTERGFQLWKRRSQPLQASHELAGTRRRESVKPNQFIALGDLENKRLWATLQWQPSWLGRLRNAVYRLPIVRLVIEDTQGRRSTFRLTPPQAATGFILNPLIEDSAGYLCFATGTVKRQIAAFMLEVPEKDRKFFHATAHWELSELPPAPSGQDCRSLLAEE